MEKQRIDEAIRVLRNLDVNDVRVHEKARDLLLSTGHFHIAMGTLPANNVLCRTRTHFDNVLFTDVEEIGTPKSGHVKRYGRCNKPSSPIFYCSDKRKTSYSELAYDWLRDCPQWLQNTITAAKESIVIHPESNYFYIVTESLIEPCKETIVGRRVFDRKSQTLEKRRNEARPCCTKFSRLFQYIFLCPIGK